MPLSALPERLQNPGAWKNSDMDNWYQRWIIKYIHGWFAYGPRATQWWAKWREWPKTLIAIKSKQGDFRIETETWEGTSGWDCVWDVDLFTWTDIYAYRNINETLIEYIPGYLSRIQYYTRWHFQIQWPLMVAFHFYFKQKDVPVFPAHENTDNKLVYCYFGAHRDADKCYWFPSAFLGLCWK